MNTCFKCGWTLTQTPIPIQPETHRTAFIKNAKTLPALKYPGGTFCEKCAYKKTYQQLVWLYKLGTGKARKTKRNTPQWVKRKQQRGN